jgi:hypothetical protein
MIATMDGDDVYSWMEERDLRRVLDWGFRKKGDARVLENPMGNHYEGCRTDIDLQGFTITMIY